MAKRAALLFAAAMLVACGARTALDDFGASSSPSSGAGGRSATGGGPSSVASSSSGSVGGGGPSSSSSTGGSALGCLSVTGPPVAVPLPPGLVVATPALVVPANSTTAVALVALLAPPLPPLGVPAEVVVSRIDPWGVWPPPMTQATELAATFIPSAFAAATSTDDDAFTLLVDAADFSGAPGGLAAAVDARTDGTATFEPLSPDHQSPLFVARTDDGVAFATEKIDPTGAAYSHVEAFGHVDEHETCGTRPLVGAALSFGSSVLFALSTQDFACGGSLPTDDARFLALGSLSPAGYAENQRYGPYYGDERAIVATAISPMSGGVWVATRRSVDGMPESQIETVGVQDDGHPFMDTSFGLMPVGLVAPSGLAMAPWRTDDIFGVADNRGRLRSFVDHRDSPAGPATGDYVDILPAGTLTDEFAAVAGPMKKEWLIAWVERNADGSYTLFIARVACDA